MGGELKAMGSGELRAKFLEEEGFSWEEESSEPLLMRREASHGECGEES